MIGLKPPRSHIIRLQSPLLVPNLDLIYLRQILLIRRRSPEIPLACVVVYSLREHPGGIFGVRFSIRFVGFCERVCGVIGLVEVFGLDRGGALECQACFFAWVVVRSGSFLSRDCSACLAFAFERHSLLGSGMLCKLQRPSCQYAEVVYT